jgi:HAMP domain-containing protein/signal transduction histidine kinase/CheY-like chemotaxis protein
MRTEDVSSSEGACVAVDENTVKKTAPARRRAATARDGGRAAAANGASPNGAVDPAVLLELRDAMRAARNGELGVRLNGRRAGLAGELARAFNDLADTRERTTRELVRVSRTIGREGRLAERAELPSVSGTWAQQLAAMNTVIDDLVRPTAEVARVIDAVADGDLSQKMALTIEGQPLKGEFLRIGKTVNAMVDQLSSFAAEVTRVAREVGTDGKLGGQARVRGVSGVWKDLTDNVNTLAANLTSQVRNIALVTTAVANGDLSRKITVDARGEVLELKSTVNTMVDQLSSFAEEVTRVAREVGTEGKLGGQATVKGVSGVWKGLTDNVNVMASSLTTQVRNIALVTTAVANGDLSKKITVDVRGEILELKDTINVMVDQLRSFAAEVTRVAKEVGTEGRLGGQAEVTGVSGVWKDLTDNVNQLAGNLTSQVRNIAQVTTAVARGDLSQKITVDVRGEIAELKDTINTMVDTLRSFADEVTRVAREVGTEGRLGGQAEVEGVSGVWKALTDNVNTLAGNLTSQVRNIALVTTAVAKGDLSRTITVDASGEILQLKNTINTMVDQLSSFADEVTRVAREVGTEGQLGGQAQVEGVSGTWRALTENVNRMASNLTGQVRNIAQVATAVAGGDLSQKITVDARGEILELKNTLNTMVDQLSSFADEVTRVAREVGSEGRLGGQAEVKGISGTWRALTDSVNFMAASLTEQVRNIADVTTAVATGDLSRKVTVDVKGEIAELKETINTMVDQLSSFADEVTRVAREVGTEGKLGGQAQVRGVSGTWKDLTDNVNFMASNLTGQVRNIAEVATAVATGDLSRKITVDARGEILELKDTINTMVDQLSSFADEVTRVAREVGSEGKLGGQAEVKGVSGTWRDLTDNVNFMAASLTEQVRNIADVTTAVANGDLSKKITVDVKGEIAELKETINVMVDQLRAFAAEVTRVAKEVGTEGRLGGQATVEGVSGVWKDLTDNVNQLAGNLTSQVRNIALVTTAVANGDLSKKITVDVRGEILELKDTINVMVDQLNSFAAEVTRVAKEVGTEGRLGGQADVQGVSGTWKDLTDNVNQLAANLTTQVRAIADVTTAVARGSLEQKITVDARGEILELKNTINTMVDQLSTFADEVTRVAREVGSEGRLGVQAEVEGVSGVWKGLTDNVNQLAQTLTTQLRAIAEVSTAVTQGDMTREITVEAAGEVAELKDRINQMIAALRETTLTNQEQDWLNSNLARFSGMLQGQRDLQTVSRLIMSELTPLVGGQHGAFFTAEADGDESELRLIATYGYKERRNVANRYKVGEALVGQAALERASILVTDPPGDYIRVASGLGEASPAAIIVMPVLFEDRVMAVIELASFEPFSTVQRTFLDQVSELIGVVLNTILATMRTEELLVQSQQLAHELQSQSEELQTQQEELQQTNKELEDQAASLKASEELLQQQQEELQQTNEELEEKAALLEEQNQRIELKNREIELARRALEEKAEQLALSSKYKSEFLANMSHELRTPLNSLLILAKLLADNAEGNLNDKQIEFAQTIYTAGSDLLDLINDILDLSKVEAGKMDVHAAEVDLEAVRGYVDRAFRPVAEQKGLDFQLEVDAERLPEFVTDEQRLQQVLKNLLSNAFKFTDTGTVRFRCSGEDGGARFASELLSSCETVVCFEVADTGIGIAPDKLRLIFEAFQQGDGTTSRRYGGTGLGLSISREIARLLGGEIHAESTLGEGSTFRLYLPPAYVPPIEHATEPAEALLPTPPAASVVEPSEPEPETDPSLLLPSEVGDDRETLDTGDRVVLIVEDDAEFAGTLLEIARERGFKGLVALRGDTGLALAREYRPDAILLDMQLPVVDGWELLDRLKRSPDTRHIPVHIVSGTDGRQNALRAGAVAFMEKPATKERLDEAFAEIASFIERGVKRLLVVEDDETQRDSIVELIGSEDDVEITAVGSSEEALAKLDETHFDCVVLDLKLPQKTGFALLEQVKKDARFHDVPIIIYTGKELTRREETTLKRYAQSIIVKDASSPERLLAETSLFLHRVEARLPASKRRMLEQLHSAEAVFEGKRVLIVDDDVRNVFALTSVLESYGMEVVYAENGKEALELLKNDPRVDLVLMDIMMPELDGYETMKAIRGQEGFAELPIIALTAKAMKGDREKSIDAGASDYVTKPVVTDQLLSLMRVWLYR